MPVHRPHREGDDTERFNANEELSSTEEEGSVESPIQETLTQLGFLEQEIQRQEELRQQLIEAMADDHEELQHQRELLGIAASHPVTRSDFTSRIDRCTTLITALTSQKRELLGLPARRVEESPGGVRGEQVRLPETPVIVENRGQAVALIRETLREALRQHYGSEGAALPFHNLEHAERVAEYSNEILSMIAEYIPDVVNDEDFDILELEAYAHDIIQLFQGSTFRLRRRGDNEVGSGEMLANQLSRFTDAEGNPVFTVTPEEVVSDVRTTQPEAVMGARLDEETTGPKFFQPFLTRDSSLRGYALALADLRGPYGRESDARVAFREGDKEFRELHLTESEQIAQGAENLTTTERAAIAYKMLNWWRDQEGFIRWQGHQMSEVLDELMTHPQIEAHPDREQLRQTLEQHYQHFEQNGRAARERVRTMEARLGVDDLMSQWREEYNRQVAEDLNNPTEAEAEAIRAKHARMAHLREQILQRLEGLDLDQFNAISKEIGF